VWSDNEARIDLLNVQHLVAAVTGIVRNQSLLPATIGVFGGWGSGKSSLISMVREQLEGDEGVVCVSFNGGFFEGYEDAKASFLCP
jgi:predicted KAP-like P-loop ATPase